MIKLRDADTETGLVWAKVIQTIGNCARIENGELKPFTSWLSGKYTASRFGSRMRHMHDDSSIVCMDVTHHTMQYLVDIDELRQISKESR